MKLAAGDDIAAEAARGVLKGAAQIVRVPSGDIWLRDTGPIFGFGEAGQRTAHCFRFNGWGGKYVMPGDTGTADALAGKEGAKAIQHDFVLEGGAVDHDGNGTVLTTRECLLNPNRNPGWSEADAERALETALGARPGASSATGGRNFTVSSPPAIRAVRAEAGSPADACAGRHPAPEESVERASMR